jgi:hypothetical protein
MNAGLAKPIHVIWFIRASAVDLDQWLAAALFIGLPPWLRDHPSRLGLPKNCCDAQSKNSNARRPLMLQADIGVELQLRDFARGEQAFVKLGPLFGRLSTKAFDVGDETVDDEIDDAVIGERHAL